MANLDAKANPVVGWSVPDIGRGGVLHGNHRPCGRPVQQCALHKSAGGEPAVACILPNIDSPLGPHLPSQPRPLSGAHQRMTCTLANASGPAISVRPHVDSNVRLPDSGLCLSLLQLILEKIFLALGGLFMVVGAGLHIAKEVGWLVSKGGDLSLHPLLQA